MTTVEKRRFEDLSDSELSAKAVETIERLMDCKAKQDELHELLFQLGQESQYRETHNLVSS